MARPRGAAVMPPDRALELLSRHMQSLGVNLGRSSRFSFLRSRVVQEERCLRLVRRPPPRTAGALAGWGRAQRLLGRKREAREAFDRAVALDARCAAAYAWRGELAGGDDVDRAVALAPSEPLWRIMRVLGGLARSFGRNFSKDSRQSLDDVSALLELAPRDGLVRVVAALVYQERVEDEAALLHLDAAVRALPREAWVRQLRGDLLWRLCRFEAAVKDYEEAVLLDEGTGWFHHALGGSDRSERALCAQASRYIAEHPSAHWMYVVRGECRRSPELNDFTGAIPDFEKALELAPRCAWAWAYMARARLMNRETDAAQAAIDRAIALRPRCGWFHVWRGEILRRMGKVRPALASFNKGLALDPDYERGYAWRGGAQRQLGRPARAVADLTLAYRLDPDQPWALHERSLAYRAMGKVREALADLAAACRLDPKYGWCSRPEQYESGLAELDGEIKRDPRNAWAWAWRGELRLRMGRGAAAERDLKRALALEPEHPRARAWLARALAQQRRPRQAMREFDRALELDPTYADALAWRGRLRAESGDLPGALRDLTSASKRDRKSSWILSWKGEVETALKKYRQARADLDRALELKSDNLEALLARARVAREQGDVEAARADLSRAHSIAPGLFEESKA